MFTGLNAFLLTPLHDDVFQRDVFERLVTRLRAAGVDSMTALGSTGSYAYLDRDERRVVAETAVQAAGDTPVMVGIGALRTSRVQALAEDAQNVGASALLLAPVSYQRLTEDDVFGLFEDVSAGLSVPLVVYDNPGTTHFAFSDELYARVATLPNVASIKIPSLPAGAEQARERVAAIRSLLPEHVTIGISGDSAAATGLNAGCEVWYSVIGGTLPALALAITRAAQAGDAVTASAESQRLQPLWEMFATHGSLRVTVAIAEGLGLVPPASLPRPLRGLDAETRARVARLVDELDLRD
jgi:4-hydroxy-tetrahydrodipicolinate synthase